MDLYLIIGPQAVGKMAVGIALSKYESIPLFHNHLSIEFAIDLCGTFATDTSRQISNRIREEVMEIFLKNNESFIYTYTYGFGLESDKTTVNNLIDRFESNGFKIYLVELYADLEERLKRNVTELRLQEKKSKRNIEWSNNELISCHEKYRMNSEEGETIHKNHLKINNTDLTVEEVINQIIKYKLSIN